VRAPPDCCSQPKRQYAHESSSRRKKQVVREIVKSGTWNSNYIFQLGQLPSHVHRAMLRKNGCISDDAELVRGGEPKGPSAVAPIDAAHGDEGVARVRRRPPLTGTCNFPVPATAVTSLCAEVEVHSDRIGKGPICQPHLSRKSESRG
jgi:hypothetical protein